MKKNKMMRLASVLLVLTLLSTSVISGTFAKYTTQDAASDKARVAKWGVELQVVGNLYGDTYGASDKIVKDDAKAFSVQAYNVKDQNVVADDIVAPGTKNDEGFTFSLNGTPEVNGKIETTLKIQNIFLKAGSYGVMVPVDVVTEANFDEFYDEIANKTEAHFLYTDGSISGSFVKADKWEEGKKYYTLEDYVVVSDDYYPVVYALDDLTNSGTTYTGDDKVDTLAGIVGVLADAKKLKLKNTSSNEDKASAITTYTGTKTFETNTNLTETLKIGDLKLTWAWAFGNEDKVGDTADENDKADTILGLLENVSEGNKIVKLDGTVYKAPVEYTDYCLDTQFDLDITVTQID